MEGSGGLFPTCRESKDEVNLFLGNVGTAMRPLTAALVAAGECLDLLALKVMLLAPVTS